MARVTQIFRPEAFPGSPDAATRADLDALWAHLFPEGQSGEPHAGYAVLANSPRLALMIARMSDYVIGELPWAQRRDLRELAAQTLNLHYKCDFSFHSHLSLAQLAGITAEQQASIAFWRTSILFDDEQRLVIEYTQACVTGDVPEELFARVVAQFGEAGAVEFTVTVGWWSLWAMLLNATRPEYSTARSQPLPKDGQELESYSPD
jgi:4-carboxymuconolactone decarboxylase